MSDNVVSLLVSVPVCSFRKGSAREYLESEQVPPPSTVYGFLLSLVGEEDRYRYLGSKIACAILTSPQLSLVLRTVWRVKNKKSSPGSSTNRRPDYQEILTGIDLGVWIAPGGLADRIRQAGENPAGIQRYGGLSLGESRDLVNDIVWSPAWQQKKCEWLVNDPEGDMPLPVWVDHVGSVCSVWRQFKFDRGEIGVPPAGDPKWITIIDK